MSWGYRSPIATPRVPLTLYVDGVKIGTDVVISKAYNGWHYCSYNGDSLFGMFDKEVVAENHGYRFTFKINGFYPGEESKNIIILRSSTLVIQRLGGYRIY